MTEQNMLSNVSLLLGKMHGGIMMILSDDANDEKDKLSKLADLERELRAAIERLYYPINPHTLP
jgi:hypothetical protein